MVRVGVIVSRIGFGSNRDREGQCDQEHRGFGVSLWVWKSTGLHGTFLLMFPGLQQANSFAFADLTVIYPHVAVNFGGSGVG
jgi:hypothetical protein